MTWDNSSLRPVWQHLHFLQLFGLSVLVLLQHGGIEGGADGGHVQADGADGSVGVDEGGDRCVVGEMVEHDEAEVGVGVVWSGGSEVTGSGHLNLWSVRGVQEARELS